MPGSIHIIAVEIVEDKIFSNDFSPQIQMRFEEIFDEIKIITERILANTNNVV